MTRPPAAPADVPSPATADEIALDWVIRRHDPGFAAADERAFREWQAADARHAEAAAHWERRWASLDLIPAADRLRLQGCVAIERAMGRPLDEGSMPPGAEAAAPTAATAAAAAPRTERPRARRAVLAAAAVAALVAVAGWQFLARPPAGPAFAQTFETPRGARSQARLPDGSEMQLDSATRLQVRFDPGHRRVSLQEGQAVFSVAPDAQQPFEVTAGRVRVTVLGTRFAVRHTPGVPGHEGVEVSVEHGRVAVARTGDPAAAPKPAGADGVVLSDGQRVAGAADGTLSDVSTLAARDFAPWRQDRVRFDDTRLDTALAELARYGEPRLFVRDPAVAALRLSGVFDPHDPATLERVLPLSLPVALREAGALKEVVAAAKVQRSGGR